MAQPAKVQEPSMEEILASIRRIISDDGEAKSGKDVRQSSATGPDPRISAGASMPPRPSQFPPRSMAMTQPPASRPDVNDNHDLDGRSVKTDSSTTEALFESLLSSRSRAAIDNTFKSLTNTMSEPNAPTVEELVKDMLRPMLKSWLDDNLPSMVERIVRTEIERLSRGR
jgi:cell pole-organizing protein PopZ